MLDKFLNIFKKKDDNIHIPSDNPITAENFFNYDKSNPYEIRAVNLTKYYGKRKIIGDISYSVKQGEIVGLLGPNGAGKTTSFYITVGFVKATAGNVYLNDLDITNLHMHQRATLGIGYLPQEASIFRKMSVEDNLLSILEYNKALSPKDRMDITDMLLAEFNITHVRKQNGYTLSGGERRRCEIARALTVNPKFILLDEPFAGVDPIAVIDIQNIIASLKDKGLGILITDHNVRDTLEITDRAIIISSGQIVAQGCKEDILESPTARKIYLGEEFKM